MSGSITVKRINNVILYTFAYSVPTIRRSLFKTNIIILSIKS